MADFDNVSCLKPVLGTADDAAMQGAVFTAWIDTTDWKSASFLAVVAADTQYDAITWTLQDADAADQSDGAAVAAIDVVTYHPDDATTTSKVFMSGYVGKKRYVRAALDDGAATTGQITALLGHPMHAPINQSER